MFSRAGVAEEGLGAFDFAAAEACCGVMFDRAGVAEDGLDTSDPVQAEGR
jgi:hypothetical protein